MELARKRLALLEPSENARRPFCLEQKFPEPNSIHWIRATRHILENLKALSSIRVLIGDGCTHSPIQALATSLDEVSKALKEVISFGNAESSFASSMPLPSSKKERPGSTSADEPELPRQCSLTSRLATRESSDFEARPCTSQVESDGAPQSVSQGYRASFDPVVCSSTIQLSKDNHVGTQASSANGKGGNVASTHGFSSGCRSWKVEFIREEIEARSGKHTYCVQIGVSALPLVINHDDSREYYSETSYS